MSDPGRYAALHAIGRAVLAELARDYAVTTETTTEPDGRGGPAPAVRLVPADRDAAPLTMVFDGRPALRVRLGGTELTLPHCRCDACAETVEECAAELRTHVTALTAGTFGERLVRDGGWWHERWYRAGDEKGSSRTRLRRAERAALRERLPGGERRWAPWPRRTR
ncbi:hypothetical protein B0I33_111267 [Prauserella shujinwangii]|uniref:Uncharacterized protein n=1 Tax=Prauserella shujinwangii TaxID=1453103 RepID=A0A2T0LNI4_9PSEU|nr:DUF6226 family protein [Prauserella shujinwangii]PRX44752.1 hypothetical protein B0I33_111267 [Prauserella shujinwangii]